MILFGLGKDYGETELELKITEFKENDGVLELTFKGLFTNSDKPEIMNGYIYIDDKKEKEDFIKAIKEINE